MSILRKIKKAITMTRFEKFAMDHNRHPHCIACGGCILDERPIFQTPPVWCMGCRKRIEASVPPGRRPWEPFGVLAENAGDGKIGAGSAPEEHRP